MTSPKKPKPKKASYKDELAKTALESLTVYLVEVIVFAIASFALSFYGLSGFVDLVVLLLFVRDIEALPERAPRNRVAGRRIVQGLLIFGISYALHDTLGALASGLLVLFIGLGLVERLGDWLDRKLK